MKITKFVVSEAESIKIKKIIIFGVFLFALFSFAQVAQAATYYVAPSGSDSSPGNQSLPFKTIQKAADIVNPGDTILVGDGVYTDTNSDGAVIYIQRGGTSGNSVTFKSQNKWGARIDGQTSASSGWYIEAPNITIQDFEIAGGSSSRGYDSVSIRADNIRIVGNNIHDIGKVCTDIAYGLDGILIAVGSYITIEQNIIHDIGRFDPGENSCNPSTTYYKNHDHGIYISSASNVTIKNNAIYNIKHGWDIQIYPNPISNLSILNNTFAFANSYRNGHVTIASNISNSSISNNISYQPTAGFINSESAGSLSNVQVKNNLIYGGIVSANTPSSGITFSGNLENTDPRFVNPSVFNFHLQSSSPAINAGITLSAVTNDYEGILRPQGSAYDIGVYEYGGVTTTPTPSPTPTATPTPTFSKCDQNHDTSINVLDLQSLANVILGKNTCTPSTSSTSSPQAGSGSADYTCDLNQDSSVNVLDLQYLANVILGKSSCP